MKTNIADLPDELLFKITNHLNVKDLLSLFQIPVFCARTARFYRIYLDNSKEAINFANQYLRNCPISIQLIEDFSISHLTTAKVNHFIFDDAFDHDLKMEVLKISKILPIRLTFLSKSLSSSGIADLMTIFSSTVESLCFVNTSWISLVRCEGLDPRKLELPNIKTFAMEFSTLANNSLTLDYPTVKRILLSNYSRKVLPMIDYFRFDEYEHLKELVVGSVVQSNTIEIFDFEKISFGKSMQSLGITVDREIGTCVNPFGAVKSLFLQNVHTLEMVSIFTIMNVDAPRLAHLKLEFSGKANTQIRLMNFNAPNLLTVSTSHPNCLSAKELEKLDAPKLEEVDIDETTLKDSSIVFQNLQSLKTCDYHLWHGKFNPSVLVNLEVVFPSATSRSGYAELVNTEFPSLENLDIDVDDAVDLLKFPFNYCFPKVSNLKLSSVYNLSTFFACQLSKFPNLRDLYVVTDDEQIKSDGCQFGLIETFNLFANHAKTFELTNCFFEKLENFEFYSLLGRYSTHGKLDMYAPCLNNFAVDLDMESINISKFGSQNLRTISLSGLITDIELGDIEHLQSLKIAQPFFKLNYGKEPYYLSSLRLPKSISSLSKDAVEKLEDLAKQKKQRSQ